MKLTKLAGLSAALMIGLSSLAFAADEPKTDTKPEAKPDGKATRLIKPWSELKDLTPEQTEKLKVIHRKYLDEIKALEAKQAEELNGVLTGDQKKELAAIEAADKASKKTPKTPKDAGGAKPDAPKTGANTGGDAKDAAK